MVAERPEGDKESFGTAYYSSFALPRGSFLALHQRSERGAEFGQPSDQHSSIIPFKANIYGHQFFTPSSATKLFVLAASNASVLFGMAMFDKRPIMINWSEGLNLSRLLHETAKSLREDDLVTPTLATLLQRVVGGH